ncbi:MAG: hypothetical protein IPP47_11320 [Bryobacterales bacterium]|nr:hypothetical protein [Bryobacterales bacterium]
MFSLLLAFSALALPTAPIVFTQTRGAEPPRLALLSPAGQVRILSQGFHSATDPEVYFDGTRILFAAKRTQADPFQIFEMNADGAAVRQITHSATDCRQPVYQSRIFTLDEPLPWDQVAYVSNGSLHSVKLDGSAHQQLTFTPTQDLDPLILPDGRMIYASQSRLFGVNLDGTDYALFLDRAGRTPAVTANREVVFVQPNGSLAAVHLDRPLFTYRPLTTAGIFHSPAGLPDGRLLAARKTTATFGLVRFDPKTKIATSVFDSPEYDDTQPRLVAPRELPDGRGSVVDERVPTAHLYCQSVFTSDQPKMAKAAKKVRLVTATSTLGEADLEDDGSFHLQIPANQAVKVQLLDAKGELLRSSSWIWARNKENRGCIGCHEDPELSPDNREAKAVIKKAVPMHAGARQ